MFLAAVALAAASLGLGYAFGRRQDRRDVHSTPVDFEKAIERISTPEPKAQAPEPQKMWAVYTPEPAPVYHHKKTKRATKRKPARRRGRL